MVRFLIPSPRTESTLPIYTPSPVVLHSPSRSDALPASPAIRLPSAAHTEEKQQQRGARFATEVEDLDDDDDDIQRGTRHNNVTFQTRPRGNTTDSLPYPTFAAYRQAQHVNFDAFAQRVKKAFALKQDQERKEKEEEKLALQQVQQQLEEERAAATAASIMASQPQQQLLRPGNSRSQSSSMVPAATSNSGKNNGTRSRSSSAAGMIGDFAERIKNGSSLFFRRSSSSFGIVTSTDSDAPVTDAASGGVESSSMEKTASANTLASIVHPVTGYLDAAADSSADNYTAPTIHAAAEQRETLMSSPPSGVEIRVTRSSLSGDDHP